MNRNFFLFLILLLLFTNCMSYIGFENLSQLGRISRVVMILLIPLVVFNNRKYPKTYIIRFAKTLMCLQLLSMIGAYVLHGQGFFDSFVVTSYALVYLMVPFMYILRIDEKALIKLCIVLGIWFAVIQVIQQFTYPTYWFCNLSYHEQGGPGMRNGIYRYGLYGQTFAFIILLYSFQRYMEIGKLRNIMGMLVGALGIYLTCNRQAIAAALGCILVGIFLKHKMKVGTFIGLLALGVLLYLNFDLLFGEYITMVANDVGNSDYIRYASYYFYGIGYNKGNPLAILIGNGVFRGTTAYGKEMDGYREIMGLYQSDVGLVGEFSLHGIIYVCMILYFFYYIFKNRKYIDLYLQLYVLYMLVTSVMLLHFRCSLDTFSTCIVLYLIDKSIARNKLASKNSDKS